MTTTTTSDAHDIDKNDAAAVMSSLTCVGGSESVASAAANDDDVPNVKVAQDNDCDFSTSSTVPSSWIHPTSYELYTKHMMGIGLSNNDGKAATAATRIEKRVGVLRYSVNHAWTVRARVPNALFLEFGVHEGKDICRIAAFVREKERQETNNKGSKKKCKCNQNQNTNQAPTPTIVHGFDSFQGLPEDWDNGQRVQLEVEDLNDHDHIIQTASGTDSHTQNMTTKNNATTLAFGKGTFDLGGVVPVMESVQKQLGTSKFFVTDDNDDDAKNGSCNVQLHAGWFHDTVSDFFDDQQRIHEQSVLTAATATATTTLQLPLPPPLKVAFVHADADLYSSTVTFLEEICRRNLLVVGSVVTFDEYSNYQGWEQGEYRAWMELSVKYNIGWKYLCYHGPKEYKANKSKLSHYGYQSVSVVITAVPGVPLLATEK
jgi:hypothetical protein